MVKYTNYLYTYIYVEVIKKMYKGSPDSCKKVIKIVSGLIHHKPCNVHKLRNILYISYLLTLSNIHLMTYIYPEDAFVLKVFPSTMS